jgi:hypothetical protein
VAVDVAVLELLNEADVCSFKQQFFHLRHCAAQRGVQLPAVEHCGVVRCKARCDMVGEQHVVSGQRVTSNISKIYAEPTYTYDSGKPWNIRTKDIRRPIFREEARNKNTYECEGEQLQDSGTIIVIDGNEMERVVTALHRHCSPPMSVRSLEQCRSRWIRNKLRHLWRGRQVARYRAISNSSQIGEVINYGQSVKSLVERPMQSGVKKPIRANPKVFDPVFADGVDSLNQRQFAYELADLLLERFGDRPIGKISHVPEFERINSAGWITLSETGAVESDVAMSFLGDLVAKQGSTELQAAYASLAAR